MSERQIIFTEGGRMATPEQIDKVLSSPEFTEGEKNFVKWQIRQCGGFYRSLWEAIARADYENLTRLGQGFPSEVAAWKSWNGAWTYGGIGVSHGPGSLYERLKAAGLEL